MQLIIISGLAIYAVVVTGYLAVTHITAGLLHTDLQCQLERVRELEAKLERIIAPLRRANAARTAKATIERRERMAKAAERIGA